MAEAEYRLIFYEIGHIGLLQQLRYHNLGQRLITHMVGFVPLVLQLPLGLISFGRVSLNGFLLNRIKIDSVHTSPLPSGNS